ncbi:MAG: hypothetical protein Q8M83_00805 [bacterium]|nr:hypothetical protein [bacterium]
MKIIKQNFEGLKNGLFVERERERERAFVCPKQIRHPTLAFFSPEADLPLLDNLIFNTRNPMQFLQRIFLFANT